MGLLPMPVWLCILKEWQQTKYGPTWPFLVGALRNPKESAQTSARVGKGDLHRLLEAIRDEMPEDRHLLIKPCYTIDETVALLSAGNGPLTAADAFYSEAKRRNTLYVSQGLFPDIPPSNLPALTEALWARYGDFIATGRFWKNGEWGEYAPLERHLIQRAHETAALPDDL
ncbi:MAG: hypothetical protein ABS97_02900 [Lysobacteraceae bacterium SCN 69-320]|nr:MAG: hypothetical protein ABS97_02900 [Xanthomonadaceae bacterium SCN 69-320]